MSIAEPMAMELEHEAVSTRISIERIPEDKFGWKPHDKSMSFAQLGSHLAESFTWVQPTIEQEEYVMDPATYVPYLAASKGELLGAFDSNKTHAIKALKNASDETMMQIWRMKVGDKVVFEMPRVAVIRSVILNHSVHHRAQLGVYLRLNDVPVPQVYGPSADEPDM